MKKMQKLKNELIQSLTELKAMIDSSEDAKDTLIEIAVTVDGKKTKVQFTAELLAELLEDQLSELDFDVQEPAKK